MQYFQDFPLHKDIKDKISRSMENNMLAHAYLFHGKEGNGKDAFAIEMAKAVNCQSDSKKPCGDCPSCLKIEKFNHPDVKFIFPIQGKYKEDEKEIKKRILQKSENLYARIEQTTNVSIPVSFIRDLKKESIYKPYEGAKKVYIISEAEKMTRESANAFLKLLEEPPNYILIILTTSSQKEILDTIRSRCQNVYFKTLTDAEVSSVVEKYVTSTAETEQIVKFSQGNLKVFFDTNQNDFNKKKQFVIDYLRASAIQNPLKITSIINDVYRMRDKSFLMEILSLLILWFKDVLHILNGGDDHNIINTDFNEELNKFASNYKNSDFESIIDSIEEAKKQIVGNIYIPVIFTVLALRIKRCLIKG